MPTNTWPQDAGLAICKQQHLGCCWCPPWSTGTRCSGQKNQARLSATCPSKHTSTTPCCDSRMAVSLCFLPVCNSSVWLLPQTGSHPATVLQGTHDALRPCGAQTRACCALKDKLNSDSAPVTTICEGCSSRNTLQCSTHSTSLLNQQHSFHSLSHLTFFHPHKEKLQLNQSAAPHSINPCYKPQKPSPSVHATSLFCHNKLLHNVCRLPQAWSHLTASQKTRQPGHCHAGPSTVHTCLQQQQAPWAATQGYGTHQNRLVG